MNSAHVRCSRRPTAAAWSSGTCPDTPSIEVTNLSRFPVRIAHLGLYKQDTGKRWYFYGPPSVGSPLPGAIPARDSRQAHKETNELAASFDFTEPVHAWAQTGTGQVIKSERKVLEDQG